MKEFKPMTLTEFYDWVDDFTENGSGTGCWVTDDGIKILIERGLIIEESK